MNHTDESHGTGDIDHLQRVFRSEPVIPLQPRPGEFEAVWAASRRGSGRRRGLLVLGGAAAAAVAVIGGSQLMEGPDNVPPAASSLDCTATEVRVGTAPPAREVELVGLITVTMTNVSDRTCRIQGPTAIELLNADGAVLQDVVDERWEGTDPGDPLPQTVEPGGQITTTRNWSTGYDLQYDQDGTLVTDGADLLEPCREIATLVVRYAGTGEFQSPFVENWCPPPNPTP